jgi:N-acetyl-anhydromuramyl-L-alanine amidase AmpD
MKRVLFVVFCLIPTARAADAQTKPGDRLDRQGDEIVVCGQLYHTTTKVVLWTDPGGFDAYRVEPRFGPLDYKPTPAEKEKSDVWSAHYNMRNRGLSPQERERARAGYDLPWLQQVVDQFVIHYDVAGTAKNCFEVLQDKRGLSVHFMLDVDGTIYQSLDLKERAWHATKANHRSVGIEIANLGAYPVNKSSDLDKWYKPDSDGKIRLIVPDKAKSTLFNSSIELRPIRNEPVIGSVQGQTLKQYDLTPQQYDALAKLTATLCTVFPKIRCDYPRDDAGKLITSQLPNDAYDHYEGLLGHYHVQKEKTDPGPAFQWDRLVETSKKLMAH